MSQLWCVRAALRACVRARAPSASCASGGWGPQAPSVFTRAVSWFSSRVLAPIADLLLEVDGLDDEDVCCCSADGWATAPPPRVVSTRTQDGDGADDADAPMPLVPSEAAPSPAPADAASLSPVAPAAVVPDIRSLALPAPTAAVCARVIALQQAGNAAALESRFDVAVRGAPQSGAQWPHPDVGGRVALQVTKYGFALMRLGAMAEEPGAQQLDCRRGWLALRMQTRPSPQPRLRSVT